MTHVQPPGIDLVASQEPRGGYLPPIDGVYAQYSLIFVVDRRNEKVLLGVKKRGFATGIVNGFGGKLEPGEDILACAVRETWEECGLRIVLEDRHHVGQLAIRRPTENLVIHYFVVDEWQGEPVETDEMAPFWVPLDAIPYDRMHPEAQINMPQLLSPRIASDRYVGFLECNEIVNKGWWMGWVPRK